MPTQPAREEARAPATKETAIQELSKMARTRPTRAMNTPSAAEVSPRSSDGPERLTMTLKARITMPKFSGGPTLSDRSAKAGANRTSPNKDSVPATKDEMAAMARAGPARPCRAIW